MIWFVAGCLVWAFLAQVAIDPGMLPVTAGLADIPLLLWGVRLAIPLIAGIIVARRHRGWPAVATLSTIAAALAATDVSVIAIPVIAGFLDLPAEFVAVHTADKWAVRYPDGPPVPSPAEPVLFGIAAGLVVGVVVWFAVAGVLWIGGYLRRPVGQYTEADHA